MVGHDPAKRKEAIEKDHAVVAFMSGLVLDALCADRIILVESFDSYKLDAYKTIEKSLRQISTDLDVTLVKFCEFITAVHIPVTDPDLTRNESYCALCKYTWPCKHIDMVNDAYAKMGLNLVE